MCVKKVHEIVVAAIMMEMIREHASTTRLGRVWLLEIGDMISEIKLRINVTQMRNRITAKLAYLMIPQAQRTALIYD
jgi:hypothetical protein